MEGERGGGLIKEKWTVGDVGASSGEDGNGNGISGEDDRGGGAWLWSASLDISPTTFKFGSVLDGDGDDACKFGGGAWLWSASLEISPTSFKFGSVLDGDGDDACKFGGGSSASRATSWDVADVLGRRKFSFGSTRYLPWALNIFQSSLRCNSCSLQSMSSCRFFASRFGESKSYSALRFCPWC